MTTKTETAAWQADDRVHLLRDIIGILFILAAILIFLALLAAQHPEEGNWIGPIGASVAGKLIWLLGRYVAFALPVMIAITAFHALRGENPFSLHSHGWLRGIGGVLILGSACALLAMRATDEQSAFDMGGLIGNIIIDAKGAGLVKLLNPLGAGLTLGAAAIIGLVMFTETLLRDLFRLTWAGLKFIGRSIAKLPMFEPLHWLAKLNPVPYIMKPFAALANIPIARWVSDLIAGISFRRREPSRVIPVGPILEITQASETHRRAPRPEPAPMPAADPVEERSGRVFTRTRLRTEPESRTGVAIEQHPPVMEIADKPRAVQPVQAEMDLFPSAYQLPSLELLSDPPSTMYTMSAEEQQRLGKKIEQTLEQFKVTVEVVEVMQGPVITRFALKVAPGVRVSRILQLESELAMALKAQHVRILAPIPGQSAVGIEVPNKRANPVMLKELLACPEFQNHKSNLAFALGRNIAGEPVICDLAQMPHLLIAGATGSGKSVCLNAIIASLLYRNAPDKVKFAMIDPKRVELSIYQAIPHLIAPVVSDTRKAAAALAWCVEQMEQRYKTLAEIGVRNADAYNAMATGKAPLGRRALGHQMPYMPHIVIIIDELADLMMVAKNEIEEYVIRLAQMARAVGMHLVLATQRPSVNVITGLIKANFPSRIAFQVSAKVDSRTILDMNGAEALLGRGDMLYSPGGAKPFRIQGCYVSDTEVERLADYIRDQDKARYEKEDFETRPTPAERAKAQMRGEGEPDRGENEGSTDDYDDGPGRMASAGRAGMAPLTPADIESLDDEALYDMALRLILESRKASVSYIQRRMKIGYARAGRIMDLMEERGIVGPYQGSKPRDLIVDAEEYLSQLDE
ncbi:DNA translocase FtsK [bacterium]|nr:DNA translocase FtsK [bacterium]